MEKVYLAVVNVDLGYQVVFASLNRDVVDLFVKTKNAQRESF